MVAESTWLIFGLIFLNALYLFGLVFWVLEAKGIRSGSPFTRFLRGWLRHPKRLWRYLARAVILGTLMLVLIGDIWLIYHLTYECSIKNGIGCDNTNLIPLRLPWL